MPRILPPPDITDADVFRFNSRVRRSSSCWIYTGQLNTSGYGVFRIGRQRYLAHRISYTIHTGTHPYGIICHRCDNPSCVNPEHLYDGTHLDNNQDRVVLERNPTQSWVKSASPVDDDVFREIRWEYECFLSEMMDKYQLQRNAVHRITANAYNQRRKR